MGRPHTQGMQEQGGQLGAAVILVGRTSQGEVQGLGQWGPRSEGGDAQVYLRSSGQV